VALAGNIGRGVLDLDPPGDGAVIVLELSSYQTELARALTPDIAVFTNLTPDHLDRHGGMGGYFAAKRRLFAEGGPDRAIIGVDEPEGRFLANQLAEGPGDERLIRVSAGKLSGPGWDISTRKGWLSEWRKGRQIASIDLRAMPGLPGAHNHQNAACAYAAVRALGLAPKLIEGGLASFTGLPHRSQRVAEIGGVAFVNDSKATNVDAAVKALSAFPRIRWICGGLAKEGGMEALAGAGGSVAKAYVIGREAEAFALALGDVPHEVCGDMARAVARAAAEAEPGDTVLLAPAAASFDQYDNFEKRGEDFIAQVGKLSGLRGETWYPPTRTDDGGTTMARVIGIGGVFLHCVDVDATRDWYARVLGMEPNDFGGFHFMHGDSAAAFGDGARTIYGIFAAGTDYFEPSHLPFMLNLMVDDLDGVLARVAEAGVEEVQERQDLDYGRFAWIMDPDGRKLELWEPPREA
jgi:UDP-N-acetylmuramoylalanine--D-glutamate ligase